MSVVWFVGAVVVELSPVPFDVLDGASVVLDGASVVPTMVVGELVVLSAPPPVVLCISVVLASVPFNAWKTRKAALGESVED